MRLEGKVALISGGARGLGAADALLFAREGAKVVIGDVLEVEGREVEAQISGNGGDVLFIRLDVTSEADWQRAIEATIGRFGKLDILVNNAGLGRDGKGVEETTGDWWDRILEVNVKGVFLGTKYVIPEMRKTGGGSIINISSIMGLVGSARNTSYDASKGAVRLFTKSSAIQYGREGIRVNSVHPGFTDTPGTAPGFGTNPERRAALTEATPLGRIATPDDIAYGVLFLASDESSFMTGSELVIDGGYTAQ